MTESELRSKLVNTAVSYLGCKESDGSHKKIIDLYNSHKPLARGYKVKYTDEWCSTFASAMAIACGLTDIIPTECGCEKHIQLFKNKNSWVENDAYVPKAGDYIFYDWQDSGVGDNTGYADHVGIVVSVTGTTIKVIEGNMNCAVGYRNVKVNAKYIRGYGVPKYADKAVDVGVTSTAPQSSSININKGDVVNFVGTKHYVTANSTTGKTCKPGKATVIGLFPTGKHPYQLKYVTGGGSTVYGWVDTVDISVTEETVYTVQKGDTLWGIAQKYLGDGTKYKSIMTLNGLKSSSLRVGQKLKLPK